MSGLRPETIREARVLVPVGNLGNVREENPSAPGPEKILRNGMGRPVLDANGKTIPLGANGKAVTKGGKRKTRKAHKRKRYSRRR
jgi:hypothetical protein